MHIREENGDQIGSLRPFYTKMQTILGLKSKDTGFCYEYFFYYSDKTDYSLNTAHCIDRYF